MAQRGGITRPKAKKILTKPDKLVQRVTKDLVAVPGLGSLMGRGGGKAATGKRKPR